MYTIRYTKEAKDDVARLMRSEPAAFKKLAALLRELQEHPTTGTGRPEQLKGFPANSWSRRITKKHRLVYQILDQEVVILILSAWGHYGDK